MDADFPAAHSMDTEWFAVDARGHVAVFVTGENGMLPRGCGHTDDFSELIARLRGRPVPEEEDDDSDYDDDIEAAARHGLFVYDYQDDLELYGPYVLQS